MNFDAKDRLTQAIVAATLIVSIILIWLAFAGYRVEAATLCAERSGGKGEHWMWREIDGRRCWYQGDRLLPKNDLHWGHDAPDQSRRPSGRTLPVEGDGLQRSHTPMQSVPHILDVPTRIVPEGMGNASNNGLAKPIDLMRGDELQGDQMLGGVLVIPPYYDRVEK